MTFTPATGTEPGWFTMTGAAPKTSGAEEYAAKGGETPGEALHFRATSVEIEVGKNVAVDHFAGAETRAAFE